MQDMEFEHFLRFARFESKFCAFFQLIYSNSFIREALLMDRQISHRIKWGKKIGQSFQLQMWGKKKEWMSISDFKISSMQNLRLPSKIRDVSPFIRSSRFRSQDSFLVAFTQLYKRLCPSIRSLSPPSVVIQLRKTKMNLYDALVMIVCFCEHRWGRYRWGKYAPAHPTVKIL